MAGNHLYSLFSLSPSAAELRHCFNFNYGSHKLINGINLRSSNMVVIVEIGPPLNHYKRRNVAYESDE